MNKPTHFFNAKNEIECCMYNINPSTKDVESYMVSEISPYLEK